MRLLLYGGTFDPPHNGHLNNLRAAAARVRPDRVVVMPAGLSPFKQSTAAPGSARVEMCACFRALEAEGAVPALCVSGWEVEQAALGRRNYTVLTLEMLARTYPEAELYMAMGSDMLLSFDSWHRWQEILRLARLVVTSRNVGDAPELHAKAKQMDPTGARILFAQVEALPMASSNLRARLAAGEACENELPALVRRVIRREGLYRADRGESGNHESETGNTSLPSDSRRHRWRQTLLYGTSLSKPGNRWLWFSWTLRTYLCRGHADCCANIEIYCFTPNRKSITQT